MPPKSLRRPTRKEAEVLSQNARFGYLSKASELLASEGYLKDAAYFGSRALKAADAQGAAVPRRIALQHCEVCGVFLSPSSCSSIECVDISNRRQRRAAAANATPAPVGPGNRSSGCKAASNVVAVVRTCQICGHRNSQPFAVGHVARQIAESEARAVEQLKLRQQKQQTRNSFLKQNQEVPTPQRPDGQMMEDLPKKPMEKLAQVVTNGAAAPAKAVETATVQTGCRATDDTIYVADVASTGVEGWDAGVDQVAGAFKAPAVHADEMDPAIQDNSAEALHAATAGKANHEGVMAPVEGLEALALPSLMDSVQTTAAEANGNPADGEVAAAQEVQVNPEEGMAVSMVADNTQEAVAAMGRIQRTGTTEDAADVADLGNGAEVFVPMSDLAAGIPGMEGQRVTEPQDVADCASNQVADAADESFDGMDGAAGGPTAAADGSSEAVPARKQPEEQGSAGCAAQDKMAAAQNAGQIGGLTTGALGHVIAESGVAMAPTAFSGTRKLLEATDPDVAAGATALGNAAGDHELGLQGAPENPCTAVEPAVGVASGCAITMGALASPIDEVAAGLPTAAMGQESLDVTCVLTVPGATPLAEQEPSGVTLVQTADAGEGLMDCLKGILQHAAQECVAAQPCTFLPGNMLERPGATSHMARPGAVLTSSRDENGEEGTRNAENQGENFEEEDVEALGKAMGVIAAVSGATGPITGTALAAMAATGKAMAAICCIDDSESSKHKESTPKEAVAGLLAEMRVVEAAMAQKSTPPFLHAWPAEGGKEISAVGIDAAAATATPPMTGEAANVAGGPDGSALTASARMIMGVTEELYAVESQEEKDDGGWGIPGITSGDVSQDGVLDKEEASGNMVVAASALHNADSGSLSQLSVERKPAALHKPVVATEAAMANAAKTAAADASTCAYEVHAAPSAVKQRCVARCESEPQPAAQGWARPAKPAPPLLQSQELLSKKHGKRTQVQTQQQRQVTTTRVLSARAGSEATDAEVGVAARRTGEEVPVLSECDVASRRAFILSEAPLEALMTRYQRSRRQEDQPNTQQSGAHHTGAEPSHKRRRAQPDWLPKGYICETSIHPLLPQERDDGALVYEAPYAQGLFDLRPVVELKWRRALHQPHYRRRFLRESALHMAHYARFVSEPLQPQPKERPQPTAAGMLRPGRLRQYPSAVAVISEGELTSRLSIDRSATDASAGMCLGTRQVRKERNGRRELQKDGKVASESEEESEMKNGIPRLGPWARLPAWEGPSGSDNMDHDQADDNEPLSGKALGGSNGRRMVREQSMQKPKHDSPAGPVAAAPESAAMSAIKTAETEDRRWKQLQQRNENRKQAAPVQQNKKRVTWAAADDGRQQQYPRKKHSYAPVFTASVSTT
ncbi:hypothetical protein VaNZ11_014790 [Volvox africanus]|uniref:Uncharacterized protein n=1 Tax=Volvox africanus TaxID=51714 RepID=A0ABQ5SJK1_9CHLO|nr:hypothetical protein VaNZ11_014790 [Volvox africanus]